MRICWGLRHVGTFHVITRQFLTFRFTCWLQSFRGPKAGLTGMFRLAGILQARFRCREGYGLR